jgi:hypothetical protein
MSRIIATGNVVTPRLVRQSGAVARQNMLVQRRTSAVFFVVPEAPPVKTTSIGLPITKTFVINEAEVGDGVLQYELLQGDEVLWCGVGDDPQDALIEMVSWLTEPRSPEDIPPDDQPE